MLERLNSCPQKDLDRQEHLRTYFADLGCKTEVLNSNADQRKRSKLANVACTLQGSSPQRIVVGAHFDHAEVGAGAVDNWSGTAFLPSLYQALSSQPRNHTFVFVGFLAKNVVSLARESTSANSEKKDSLRSTP